MKNYWFSFSYEGVNMGVCIVQAECEHEALQKTIDLGIHPRHDDIAGFELKSLDEEGNLEFNRLYSREEMIQLGYAATNIIK